MDLRQIRYFLTVAEERNITRAADRLHLSQPPLSRALMDLEEELGCTLIIRGKRHVTLTPEGLALKRRGEQILALADIAKTEITDVKKGLSGTLYLGHVDSNGPSLAAEWISSFKKEYPNVTYNLWCGTVDDLTYRMKSGLLELAITMTPLNTEQLDGITVYSDTWAAIIPGSHPLAKSKKQTVTLKDIVDTDLIISSRHSREEEIRSWFEKYTGQEPRFIVKTAHSSNASKLVDQNIGIAIFPASVAKNISADSNVVVKTIKPEVNVDYVLSWDKEKMPSALASKFIEHVRNLYS
ncbi:MAG: LysR family transcriptional regulator [Saccharofermentans sp.]|nr:LysR family transcriptional regulator [Saccharofermentans sp.]